MRKKLRVRMIHAACLLLMLTPLAIAVTAAFTLDGRQAYFFPLLAVVYPLTGVLSWLRSGRRISRIYWALMLSQFVLVLSFEVWCALKLAKILSS